MSGPSNEYTEAAYTPPVNDSERRVWHLRQSYESIPTEKREAVREELDKLRKSGELRFGYQVLAGFIRIEINGL